jgi:hypothetical protein
MRVRSFATLQRPINGACLQEKAPKPLWKTLPSWYLLAEQDRRNLLIQRIGISGNGKAGAA